VVRGLREAADGRPGSVDRGSHGRVAYVRAEPLDVERVAQERVAVVVRIVRYVEDRIDSKHVGEDEEVQVQGVVPYHEPVVG
jgi:hypothetical protein